MSELNETRIILAEGNPADVILVAVALKEHAIDCKRKPCGLPTFLELGTIVKQALSGQVGERRP